MKNKTTLLIIITTIMVSINLLSSVMSQENPQGSMDETINAIQQNRENLNQRRGVNNTNSTSMPEDYFNTNPALKQGATPGLSRNPEQTMYQGLINRQYGQQGLQDLQTLQYLQSLQNQQILQNQQNNQTPYINNGQTIINPNNLQNNLNPYLNNIYNQTQNLINPLNY